MDVSPYVDRLGREVRALAEIESEGADAQAARLESAIRLTLVDALAAAADEINRDLAAGSVELRFRGGERDFVVTPPSPERSPGTPAPSGSPHPEEGATAGIDLRMSGRLKAAIEHVAGDEGLSAQAWLGRMALAMVRQHGASHSAVRRGKRARQRYTAWVR